MRKSKFVKQKLRQFSFIGRALASSRHPVLAHLIPMRRCNLACGYCNEYDHTSSPVPIEIIKQRLDKLASLGTSIVTISGGEPMMHPELDEIIRHIRRRGMIAGLISAPSDFEPRTNPTQAEINRVFVLDGPGNRTRLVVDVAHRW